MHQHILPIRLSSTIANRDMVVHNRVEVCIRNHVMLLRGVRHVRRAMVHAGVRHDDCARRQPENENDNEGQSIQCGIPASKREKESDYRVRE